MPQHTPEQASSEQVIPTRGISTIVTYYLSETGRRASLLAGGNGRRAQTLSVDVPAGQAGLVGVNMDGAATASLTHEHDQPINAQETLAMLIAAQTRRTADQEADQEAERASAKARAEEDTRRVETARQTRDQWLTPYLSGDLAAPQVVIRHSPATPCYTPDEARWMALTVSERKAVQDEAQRRVTVREAAKSQADAEAKAEATAKRAAKADYLRAWVEAHSPSWAAQQREGLMCHQETVAALAAETLDPIAPEYTVPACCQDIDHKCEHTDLDCLPSTVYPALVALRTRLPAGASCGDYIRHRPCLRPLPATAEADDDGDRDRRDDWIGAPEYSAQITIVRGPFTFTRLVRLA